MSKVKFSSGHYGIGTGASGIVDEVREARKIANRTAEILSKFMEVEVFHDNQSKSQNENINRIVAWHNRSGRMGDYAFHLNSSGGTKTGEIGLRYFIITMQIRLTLRNLQKQYQKQQD